MTQHAATVFLIVDLRAASCRPAADTQLFGNSLPDKCSMTTEQEVAEWDYGKYEGMLTKDIRKEHPGWDIWTEG